MNICKQSQLLSVNVSYSAQERTLLCVCVFLDGDDQVHPAVPVLRHQPHLVLDRATDPGGQHRAGGIW